MSYSFSVTGKTKGEAIGAAVVELCKVVTNQPAHAADVIPAAQALAALVGKMRDRADADVVISCAGSVWATADGLESVGLNFNAYFGPAR